MQHLSSRANSHAQASVSTRCAVGPVKCPLSLPSSSHGTSSRHSQIEITSRRASKCSVTASERPPATASTEEDEDEERVQIRGVPSSAPEFEMPSRQVRSPSADSTAAMDQSLQVQMVNWYPGHIAKAERQLKEQLNMVDVVLEIRDARIISSTSHPQVPQWVGSKPRLLVINRTDSIQPLDRRLWTAHFKSLGSKAFWTDGKLGDGVAMLRQELIKASLVINAKRAKRGLRPRPVRACVIGFPNIGKSALINRLLNRKVVESAPKPGVTRMLRWVRLGGELDLLDAPGVIPASFDDQIAAQRLAMCNDIGEAAYVESLVAAALVVRCKTMPNNRKVLEKLQEKYKRDPLDGTAEDFVQGLADRIFFGDRERAGARLLKDFRGGNWGSFALEVPPKEGELPETFQQQMQMQMREKTRDVDWHREG